ncbi:ABC transporter substrate-binding protein [Phyllobacterium endophyticum]|uniref:ABC transporter substrate-binding protein n=1 Tax=Phyllobacterium endophyticum TaxID=1149773 RepID=A0A2P7AS45_9HYPH|nr:sugar ABC transporter substrate-binding protein [Phyllobacterium endophyticum]MBB3236769.1 multiple sugar transport system substrate-binding protein [Phyllobacterium endophyticum]PSH57045.1 ABC transporter substrate-binding protein [Phyllobacterium endophyticum]TYR40324.1 sugar ABC transporter substrate-binding protein [Phyllobacterium endophyticum]
MKLLKIMTLAATALGVLSTCALAQEKVTMWSRSTSEAFMPALIKAFNASHETQIELQIVPSSEMVQKYATAAAGGSAPDFVSLDLVYAPAFAKSGALEDLTDLAKSLPYFDQLSKAHVGTGTYDGRIYALPMSADASVLLWNKRLFKQAGLDPEKGPTNWSEIEEAAGKVNALGGDVHGFYFSGACGGCNAFTFMPLIWASGGDILVDDGKRATIDTPQMHEAINFYRNLVAKGLVPESAKTDSGKNFFGGFATDKIGLSPIGAFAIGNLVKNYPTVEFGVTFIPGKNGGKASFAGGDNFVVTAGRDNTKAAKEFLEFVYSIEGQTLLAKGGSLPTRADIAAEAIKSLDERYQIATEAMKIGRTPSSPVYNDIINSSTGPWKQMLNEAFFGDDARGSVAKAQAAMQSILDSSN